MSLPANIVKASSAHNESRDCAVKALAIVTGKPYKVAHAELKSLGRRDRGTTRNVWLMAAIKNLGKNFVVTEKFKAKTISTLEKELPQRGIFLVFVKGHVIACRAGKVLDWTEGRRYRIKMVLRITSA